MIERDLQPFEDVIAGLGLAQLELGAAADDFAAELDEALDELEQVEDLRPAADDRQHDDAEARLQRRVLVEVVQTTSGTSPRFSSMTIRMPSRSDSSRRSEMPSIVFSRTRSAIRSISFALFT